MKDAYRCARLGTEAVSSRAVHYGMKQKRALLMRVLISSLAFLGSALLPGSLHGQTHLTGKVGCAECAIRIVGRLVLGDRNDSTSAVAWPRVAVAGGRIFVTSDMVRIPGAIIFDERGDLIGHLGRSGEGPGEMRRSSRIANSTAGEIFIHDIGRRIHVFRADGTFHRMLPGVPHPGGDLRILADSVFAISATRRPAAAPDRTIHLYSVASGAFLAATGPQADLQPGTTPRVIAIAQSTGSRLWVVEKGGVVSRWNYSGEFLESYIWDPGWLEVVNPDYRQIRADHHYVLHDVWEAPNGLLWVVSVFDDPLHHMGETIVEGPLPLNSFTPAAFNARKNSVVSVLDPDRNLLLAHLQIDEAVFSILSDGRLVIMREASDGYQWIELIKIDLIGWNR